MSTLKVNQIQDTGGNNGITPSELKKGIIKIYCDWKMKNGLTINNSYNVSSITDNGTGDQTINFSITLASANYSMGSSVMEDHSSSGSRSDQCLQFTRASSSKSTTSCRLGTFFTNSLNFVDCIVNTIMICGDE
tara:strand:- start:92 stop:493 length:402 start_codon:yes stop_codon:yes gene_type:complete